MSDPIVSVQVSTPVISVDLSKLPPYNPPEHVFELPPYNPPDHVFESLGPDPYQSSKMYMPPPAPASPAPTNTTYVTGINKIVGNLNVFENTVDVSSVSKLTLRHSVKEHYVTEALVDTLIAFVQNIPNFASLKQDPELILQVYSMIEVITKDSKAHVEKLDVVLRTYNGLFDMTTVDTINLVNIVNFLNTNKTFVYKGKTAFEKLKAYIKKMFA